MTTSQRSPFTPRLILGALALVIGILMLLGNFGVLETALLGTWWPTIFVVLGLIQVRWGQGAFPRVLGLGFVIFGGLLIFANLSPETLSWVDILRLWPVLLIFAGGYVIYRTLVPGDDPSGGAQQDERVDGFVVMAGLARRIASPTFKGGELTAVMGGYEIDLREASITEGEEAVLSVFALMGGGEIRVPEDWSVVSDVVPVMGGVQIKAQGPARNTTKQLRIKGLVIMGGIEVKH